MPTNLNRVLNHARLETESYDMMVQHLEREMELNGLLAPNETNITRVHQIESQETQQAPNPSKPSGPCYGCGQSGHVVKNCRKVAREARNRGNRVPNKIVDPCETYGKKSHTTQDCYSGANWANRPQWWKTPQDYASKQHSDNTTTRSVRKRQLTTDPTPIPQPSNWPNGLPTPAANNNTIQRTNPAKKLVLPHLQFGETVEIRHFTISEPPNTYDHQEHNERREQPSLDWQ